MRLKWKFQWLAIPAFLALLCSGCSGINTGGSVSPMMFLLRNDTPAHTPAPPPEVSKPVALAKQ